ncbi:uncharacterized protein VTP21DRAFT_9644 [Calcarisporiella thermophila]|uniref:uncharacterized protein n=1 Tax=Calcarisporiella thermophila TaxID=911321 RepID=UPI0037448D92
MQLNCMIKSGDEFSDAFPVDIIGSKSVHDLKKLIREGNKQLEAFDIPQIKLWKIDIPFDAFIQSIHNFDNISRKFLSPLDEIRENFPEEPKKKHIHIIVELPITEKDQVRTSYSDMASVTVPVVGPIPAVSPIAPNSRWLRFPPYSHMAGFSIPTIGPVVPNVGWLMLPFSERNWFNSLLGDFRRASFVIHGPYQSGKTSLLMAIQDIFEKNHINYRFFDMPPIHGYTRLYGPQRGFYYFISQRIFSEPLEEGELHSRLNSVKGNFYILMDEFQSIFQDNELLEVAKVFFRSLSQFRNIFYLAVGTFKIVDLRRPGTNELDSPFNKAHFRQIPFFTTEDMGKLFRLYKELCFRPGIPDPIQASIIRESLGHPASFMILLKIFNECQPSSDSWNREMHDNLEKYMNGTHIKFKHMLQSKSQSVKAYIRKLTCNMGSPWYMDLENLSEIDKELLDVGILVPIGEENTVSFTSCIILRVCIGVVGPKSNYRLTDIPDPIELLALGLQQITPETINDERVRNRSGPSETSFQAALFSVWNSLVPSPMKCLVEMRARNQDTIDLMVVNGQNNWAAYELKVNKVTTAEFRAAIQQAKKYADHYQMTVYLVNFYLEGLHSPVLLDPVQDVVVVNVMHNASCSKFTIFAPNYHKEILVFDQDRSL